MSQPSVSTPSSGEIYKVPMTNQEIGKLSEALDIVVKHVGLQHPYMVEFALAMLEKCRKTITTQQSKPKKNDK